MSKNKRSLFAAVIALLAAAGAWYYNYTDNDPQTKPNTGKVINATVDVIEAVTDKSGKGENADQTENAETINNIPDTAEDASRLLDLGL